MPELPEVETVKRGLEPFVIDQTIQHVVTRCEQLRWPIPSDLEEKLRHQQILQITRRGKYLVFQLSKDTLIIHLGMSGRLGLVSKDQSLKAHDHVDIGLSSGLVLRYNDARRFGAILWTKDKAQHPLLQTLGLEPLEDSFNVTVFKKLILRHKTAIKSFLMNGKIIVGIGNIYAAEALFLAAIHPLTPTNQLTDNQCKKLVAAIKTVLQNAIAAGGTTLKDFLNSEGKPGYFAQQLSVYGRANLPCLHCNTTLQAIVQAQRTTVFCPTCQKR